MSSGVTGLNTFVALTVPGADGFGAAVSVSGITEKKELYVNSDEGFDGEFTILGTHNGTGFTPLAVVRGQAGVPVKVAIPIKGTYQQLRIFRRAFGTSPTMGIAGQATCACT